jgi:ATP-dependent DNA helicase RecQ
MPDLAAAQRILRTTFGFEAFRAGQSEIIAAVFDGRDVLTVMPTGSGKSLCYQLPALLRDHRGVAADCAHAQPGGAALRLQHCRGGAQLGNDPADNRSVLDRIARGGLRLVYVAPERLVKPQTLDLIRRAKVLLLAVDEAPASRNGAMIFVRCGARHCAGRTRGVQTVAFTATADAATRTDILQKLFPRAPAVFVHGFDRSNLRLAMAAKSSGRRQITDFVKAHQRQSGIVFCASQRRFGAGRRQRAPLSCRHGSGRSLAFLQEDGIVVAATVAFGMGIDKPDVRFVLHADMPANIESYYQEVAAAAAPRQSTARSRRRKRSPPWCAPANASAPNT